MSAAQVEPITWEIFTELPEPYYDDHWTTLYYADCRSILPLLANKSVSMVLTDPPYEKEAHGARRRVKQGKIEKKALPFGAMDEPLRRFVVDQTKRLTDGWSIFFCQAEAIGKYQSLMGPCYRRPLLWFKPDAPPQLTGDRPSMAFESMALSHHEDHDPEAEEDYETLVASWHGEGRSIWTGRGKRGVYVHSCTTYVHHHPTQKSPLLMTDLLKDFAVGTDAVVLDMFAGAGSTLVEAKRLGIKSVGIELDEEWAEYAANWLEQTEPGVRARRVRNAHKQLGLEDELPWG
jgi:site-specific DNA-methyltransferase (adenine-specific)